MVCAKSRPAADRPTATAISPCVSTRACGTAIPSPSAVLTRLSRSMSRVRMTFLLGMSFCLARMSSSSSMAWTLSLAFRSWTTWAGLR